MSDLYKTVVIVEELPPEHPHAFPEYDSPHRGPLPEEAALLVLLEAARIAACRVVKVHNGDSTMACECPCCETAAWILRAIDYASSCIGGDLQMGKLVLTDSLDNRAKELASNPWKED